jgi:phosphoribosylaminoimidazole-succinocarboxamide synthase
VSEAITAVSRTSLPGLLSRGKVRDIYDLGDRLMIVATDRISAFDVVMDQPVPGKGVVLTQLSQFWLETLPACTPHHLEYVVDDAHVPPGYEQHVAQLRGRAMVVRKARVLPIECVVRGYVAGGGWKEYQETGSVSGIGLPAGLKLAEKLPEPLFTPSTKAAAGHDEPIPYDRAAVIATEFMQQPGIEFTATYASGAVPAAGRAVLDAACERAVAIYAAAARYAEQRGIILADTKFEFGLSAGELLLIDEVLTPDSSRFWPADQWQPGQNPPSFDKQFLRDYLNTLDWNKQPPPPRLPADIVAQTRERYVEAFRTLTGRPPAF